MIKKPAIFLDRDGVINRKMPEGSYVTKWSEFEFLPGVFKALQAIKSNSYIVIIVTNQRCIARGMITKGELNKLHEAMLAKIRSHGGNVDAIYYCPHDIADKCTCRKPEAGMIFKAIEDFKSNGVELDVANSYIVGDSDKDLRAGKPAGLKSVSIGDKLELADIKANSLLDATNKIFSKTRRKYL